MLTDLGIATMNALTSNAERRTENVENLLRSDRDQSPESPSSEFKVSRDCGIQSSGVPSPRSSFLVTAAEVAAVMNVTAHTVRDWARKENWPRHPDHHAYHIYDLPNEIRGAVESWLATQPLEERLFISQNTGIYKYTVDQFTPDELAGAAAKADFVLETDRLVRESGGQWTPVVAIQKIVATVQLEVVKGFSNKYELIKDRLNFECYCKWRYTWDKWRPHHRSRLQYHCLADKRALAWRIKAETDLEQVRLTEAEERGVKAIALDCDSTPEALRQYIRTRNVRPVVRELLTQIVTDERSMPDWLARQLYIPEEVRLRHRSASKFGAHYLQFRDRHIILRDGTKVVGQAGDLFEADDMTVNQPWWVEWPYPDGTDKCVEKFGVRVGRGQLLAMRDVFSGAWLPFTLLMRQRDSYRSADIWRWLRLMALNFGLPRLGYRFERGIWHNRMIDGVKLRNYDGSNETEDTITRRLGGLTDLGLYLARAYNSKGKNIEQAFDPFQTTLAALDNPGVGRQRGEYEKATRWLGECQAGTLDPRQVEEFLPLAAMTQLVDQAFGIKNATRINGRIVNGVPNELWAASVAARPLAKLPADKEWLFLPERRELSVSHGLVTPTLEAFNKLPFPFEVADFAPALCEGYRVVCCFDPVDAGQGAWLFSNEPRPMGPWKIGDFIGRAPLQVAVAQLDMREITIANEGRKKFNAAFRSVYKEITRVDKPGKFVAEANDGHGGTVRVESDSPRVGGTEPAMVPPARGVFTAARRRTLSETNADLVEGDKLEREMIERGELVNL